MNSLTLLFIKNKREGGRKAPQSPRMLIWEFTVLNINCYFQAGVYAKDHRLSHTIPTLWLPSCFDLHILSLLTQRISRN